MARTGEEESGDEMAGRLSHAGIDAPKMGAGAKESILLLLLGLSAGDEPSVCLCCINMV